MIRRGNNLIEPEPAWYVQKSGMSSFSFNPGVQKMIECSF